MMIEKKELNNVMSYPVGMNISENLDIINSMSNIIMGEFPVDKKLNLICRGSSGAIIAGIVASRLLYEKREVRITHIKKDGEESHSAGIYINDWEVNIIIDDFISTGSTIRAIYKKLADYVGCSVIVDMLIVSGNVSYVTLNFKPEVFVSGGFSRPERIKFKQQEHGS